MNWIRIFWGLNKDNIGILCEGKIITNQKTKKTQKPTINPAPTKPILGKKY